MDGLIILDTQGKPIITSHFRTPAHAGIYIDAFNRARARARARPSGAAGYPGGGGYPRTTTTRTTREEVEPVVWVNVPSGLGTRVKRGTRVGEGYGSSSEEDSGDEEEEEEGDDEDEVGEVDAGTWRVAGLCHLEREGMSFLAPLSHEGEPFNVRMPFHSRLIPDLSESAVWVHLSRVFSRCAYGVLWTSDGKQHTR